METKKMIAERIKELRKELNLTQQELADATGITVKSIRNYENCVREPNSKSMAALERFFNVSGEFIRGETSERHIIYSWDDPEIMNEIYNSFGFMLKKMIDEIQTQSDHDKKSLFDILSGLQSIIDIKDENVKTILLEQVAQNIYNQRNLADKMANLSKK